MPMTDAEFDAFVESSSAALQQKQEKLKRDYGIGAYTSWSYDGNDGRLCFSDDTGRLAVRAETVQIGSFAIQANTWKWAWSNASIPAAQREQSHALTGLFDRTGYEVFRNEACEVDEQMAWQIAAMAAEHLGGTRVLLRPS